MLMLPLLAGCGIFGKQVSLELTEADKQRCPPVGILAYAGEITRFQAGPGRTTDDVINRGTISGLTVSCFNTGTVFGRTPRHRKNDSAACSTSIPQPMTERAAPCSAPHFEKGVGVSP